MTIVMQIVEECPERLKEEEVEELCEKIKTCFPVAPGFTRLARLRSASILSVESIGDDREDETPTASAAAGKGEEGDEDEAGDGEEDNEFVAETRGGGGGGGGGGGDEEADD